MSAKPGPIAYSLEVYLPTGSHPEWCLEATTPFQAITVGDLLFVDPDRPVLVHNVEHVVFEVGGKVTHKVMINRVKRAG